MGKKQYRVNVYEGGDVIARVRYNQNLDYWDGFQFLIGRLRTILVYRVWAAISSFNSL